MYHDRKMLKWLPFEALEPQREALKRLFHERDEARMPEVSDDQSQANQYKLEEALRSGEVVRIHFFEDGERHTLFTSIIGLDAVQRELKVEQGILNIEKIIEID